MISLQIARELMASMLTAARAFATASARNEHATLPTVAAPSAVSRSTMRTRADIARLVRLFAAPETLLRVGLYARVCSARMAAKRHVAPAAAKATFGS